ncbi:hypothetical protein Tco_0885423 [Tanacetum coccineum]
MVCPVRGFVIDNSEVCEIVGVKSRRESCHEPDSERSSSAWKAYMNARVAGLFMLVLLEYLNGKGVVRITSRGLDMALHWSGVGVAPLMSPRQDETSEPLLYAGWMAGPCRCKDATRGRNDDPVTSGIRAKLDRGGPKQNRSSCFLKKFLKVLVAQSLWECVPGMLKSQYDVVWSSQYRIRWKPESNGLIQMVDDSRCTLDLKSSERVMD